MINNGRFQKHKIINYIQTNKNVSCLYQILLKFSDSKHTYIRIISDSAKFQGSKKSYSKSYGSYHGSASFGLRFKYYT